MGRGFPGLVRDGTFLAHFPLSTDKYTAWLVAWANQVVDYFLNSNVFLRRKNFSNKLKVRQIFGVSVRRSPIANRLASGLVISYRSSKRNE